LRVACWRFPIDECVAPAIARRLRAHDVDARHVQEVPELGKGADDAADHLPYVLREDAILVTNNFHDFGDVAFDEHEGILLVYDGERSAHEYASAIARTVEAYPGRAALRHREPLDDWL